MEKLKEILSNIKERFSSPLFFSFICSWIAFNWEIVVSLLLYDTTQINKENCTTIFEFIRWKLNTQGSLYKPILFAIAYTILYPFIKNFIRILYSWIEKKSENIVLDINNDGKVSIEKYVKIREDYNKRSKILEEIIEKESVTQNEVNEIRTQLYKLELKNGDLSQEVITKDIYIRQMRNLSIFNGYWTNTYSSKDPVFAGEEDIFVENGKYYLLNTLGAKIYIFDIRDFYYDSIQKSIFFVKDRINQNTLTLPGVYNSLKYNINNLEIVNNDLFTGTENGTTTISYKRTRIDTGN